MAAASATPLMAAPTVESAREELSKFFKIAQMADEAPGMFSAFIDVEWHRLADTAEYTEFCQQAVGGPVAHAPLNGEGEVAWLGMYHEMFGDLPAAWFADKDGVVDTGAFARYRDTRTVRASWNCTPDTSLDATTDAK
jgi:hypothetical protein